jgi:hypothetical protein
MRRSHVCCVILGMMLCACEVVETSATDQELAQEQGINMQGINMQGINMQGMNLLGFRLTSATMADETLQDVRVSRGEVIAERGPQTLRGAALVGAHFPAEVRDTSVTPARTALVEFRITGVTPELDRYDPTETGNTFLYTLEQRNPGTGSWHNACPADEDGRRAAIPLAAIWDERGDRIESSSMFTFGCTSGVIAKCYRWGYRPWVTGYGDLVATHWTCTRMARADYCGIGVPHTRNGTRINVWDNLPRPGPIQRHGLLPPLGMLFEAAWNTGGAVCLSHSRWLLEDGLGIAQVCPDRLLALGVLPLVCDTVPQALGLDPGIRMFNEAYLNIDLL